MAINNTNTINTNLGVDVSSTYIRLHLTIKENGNAIIEYRFYSNKTNYLEGLHPINDSLPTDLVKTYEINTPLGDWSKDSIHDLAITELVARGMDNTKLAKVDLV